MVNFFPDALDEFLTPDFLKYVREKFHYEETNEAEFRVTAEAMLPLMRKEAFWERKDFSVKGRQAENRDVLYESVVMSLGKGLDELQESYSQKGLLSQSYMVEVLASELLMKGYEAYNRYRKENTDWHVAQYHFPGSEEAFPIELLPQMLQEITLQVTCNTAFCMMPKKSVVFVAELTQDEDIHCQGICAGCQNEYCANRIADDNPAKRRIREMTDMPLTYGYSRIFGIS